MCAESRVVGSREDEVGVGWVKDGGTDIVGMRGERVDALLRRKIPQFDSIVIRGGDDLRFVR